MPALAQPDAAAPDAAARSLAVAGHRGRAGRWRVDGPLWGMVLALASGPGAWLTLAASYPGRANIDVRHQAEQALGRIPYDDWHPVAMSALWAWLHQLTGTLGSLLVLQIGLLGLGGWLLARLLGAVSGSRLVSLLGVACPLLPHVVSQSGILFKDSLMGAVLLVGSLLLARADGRRPRTLFWLLPAVALLVYGGMVRRNALAAVAPLLLWVAWQLCVALAARRRVRRLAPARSAASDVAATDPTPRPTHRLAAMARGAVVLGLCGLLTLGATLGLDQAIGKAVGAKATSQVSQVYLDDVIFSVPAAEIEAAAIPADLKAHLLSAQHECLAQDERWDAYWNCYGRGATGKPFSPVAHQRELASLWRSTVLTHPGRYLAYRAGTFGDYLAQVQLVWWEQRWTGDARTVGLGGGDHRADALLRAWVVDGALKHAPWLFAAWFWLAAGGAALLVGGIGFLRTRRQELAFSAVMAASAVAYQLAYFPVIPAAHFRYTWWSALAVTVSLFLLGASAVGMARERRRLRGRPHTERGLKRSEESAERGPAEANYSA